MQVLGDQELLDRNLAPKLFNKMAQLGCCTHGFGGGSGGKAASCTAETRGGGMRRLSVLIAAACAAAAVASSGSATIHPLMVGWVCGNASGDPPGQTPGEAHSDQSTFRALQATGIVVGVDPATGLPIFDLTKPAAKFSSFVVVPEETGTPSNEGALNCVKGELLTA
jgi:hypothetical protein